MELLLPSRQKAFVCIVLQVCWRFLNGVRGVFKKRPNFLNSASTSTESALRLLSAPSVRFWLQTAICPVSLRALVVELHPLNWAHAQTVRWIGDTVTMKELEEQRVCVKFGASCVNILHRHFNCLTKHTGRTVWAERSAVSGLSVLKRAECRSVKIPGLDDLPHQQTTTMARELVLWFMEIVLNCPRSWWRSGHQHRILS